MHKICATQDIANGEARGCECNGQSYIVVRRADKWWVYRNRCPHLGIPLEWQPHQFLDHEGEFLRCATHGALFLIESGDCIAGPCAGDMLQPVPFVVADDALWLTGT